MQKENTLTVEQWCGQWFTANRHKWNGNTEGGYRNLIYSHIIRYNAAKGYEGIIEHHIIPAIGAIKLKQLSSIHIQRMYNDLKENGRMPRGAKQNDKPLSNTFVRRVHAVLQAALKQAVKERLIPYNPCENCRIPPKDKKEMTILPPEKIGRYLQEAEKYGVLPMFYLELSSGLRRGELLLDPGEFYILASSDDVEIPVDQAAEMTPIDPSVGEFRVHYAGFFDPGFGTDEAHGAGSKGVLEVRTHDTPFLLEHGQIVARLVYEPLTERPTRLYGEGGSHYQSQGLKLSKHFRPWG